MAQAPNKGLKFTVDNRKCVLGAFDNGDSEVIVLAVEKAAGSNDYSWEVQVLIDYILPKYEGNIDEAMADVIKEVNDVLEVIFGKVNTPESDIGKIQAYIVNNLTYNPSTNKIENL